MSSFDFFLFLIIIAIVITIIILYSRIENSDPKLEGIELGEDADLNSIINTINNLQHITTEIESEIEKLKAANPSSVSLESFNESIERINSSINNIVNNLSANIVNITLLNNILTPLRNDINNLKSNANTGNNNNGVSSSIFNSTITRLEAAIQKLQNEKVDLQEYNNDLQQTQNNNNSDNVPLSVYEAKMRTIDAAIEELKNNNNRSVDLEELKDDIDKRFAKVDINISSFDEQIQTATNNLGTLKSTVTTFKNDYNANKTTTNNNIETIKNSVTTANNNIETLDGTVSTFKNNYDSNKILTEEKISEITTKLVTSNETITALTDRITAIPTIANFKIGFVAKTIIVLNKADLNTLFSDYPDINVLLFSGSLDIDGIPETNIFSTTNVSTNDFTLNSGEVINVMRFKTGSINNPETGVLILRKNIKFNISKQYKATEGVIFFISFYTVTPTNILVRIPIYFASDRTLYDINAAVRNEYYGSHFSLLSPQAVYPQYVIPTFIVSPNSNVYKYALNNGRINSAVFDSMKYPSENFLSNVPNATDTSERKDSNNLKFEFSVVKVYIPHFLTSEFEPVYVHVPTIFD